MTAFAVGKKAYGYCDRCGFRYPLHRLRSETYNGAKLSNRVCPKCFDADHPQNFLDRVKTDDAIALRDPRPDLSLAASRQINITVEVTGLWVETRIGDTEVSTT